MTMHVPLDTSGSRIARLRPRREGKMTWAWPFGWSAVLLAGMVAALWVGWVGFIASDDSLYYEGAMRWLTDPPFAGDNHWSTRFPLTLTFASVIALVGHNFLAFAVIAVLFYVVIVAVAGMFAAQVAGMRAGWIAALLTATLPVIVANATSVSVDLIEASAVLIGVMLLGGAGEDRAGLWRGVGAGAAFGIAMLCRETTALPLVGLAPIFLLGKPVSRRVLIASGIGFAAVIGGEALFQYALTGDPLRRYAIAFHHDEHIDRAANMEGNFLLWTPIDPLLVLLINDDFGLLFWVAGAALWFGALRTVDAAGKRRLTVLAAMAAASFVLVALLVHKLVLNPRYFTLPALAAVMIVAIWLDRARPRVRIPALIAIVGSNLLLMSVGNAHPRWEMEALIAASAIYPREIVAGDPEEVRRASLPMRFAGRDNIRYAPAKPGGLVIAHADGAPAGRIVARYPSPPTRLGGLLRAIGVEPLVPASIAKRMFAPGPTIVLVRTPAG